jgi:hypothetical protein
MAEENDSEPTFRMPDEKQKQADNPFADQQAYFAYYEAKRITDETNRRREWASLSVYERARLKYQR